jgi:hypothetical protein
MKRWRKTALAFYPVIVLASCSPTLRSYTPSTKTFSDRAGVLPCTRSAAVAGAAPWAPGALENFQADISNCYSPERDYKSTAAQGASCVRVTVDRDGTVIHTEAPWPFLSDGFLDCLLAKTATLRFPYAITDDPREFRISVVVVR